MLDFLTRKPASLGNVSLQTGSRGQEKSVLADVFRQAGFKSNTPVLFKQDGQYVVTDFGEVADDAIYKGRTSRQEPHSLFFVKSQMFHAFTR